MIATVVLAVGIIDDTHVLCILYIQASWIFPWDGNCFVTPKAWHDIRSSIFTLGHAFNYFITPMGRVMMANTELLQAKLEPSKMTDEPQIISHADAGYRYTLKEKQTYMYVNWIIYILMKLNLDYGTSL